jgi:hypothetical protein
MQALLDAPVEEDLPKDIMQKAAQALSERKKALKAKQQTNTFKSRNPAIKLPGAEAGAKAPNTLGKG